MYTEHMPFRKPDCRLSSLSLVFGLLLATCQLWGAGSAGTDLKRIRTALAALDLPSSVSASIQARIDAAPQPFLLILSAALEDYRADPMLFFRVDKEKALPPGFSPSDLVTLEGTDLSVNRAGHRLRRAALAALQAMDAAARADGVTLLVSSSYRSFAYQVEVWDRSVKAEGEAETAASVARPGHSQHQLGTAVDFGSITDAFAETKASRWLAANAHRFGYSLSFPRGLSAVTGYKWESWHYRYIGVAAAKLETEYFGGVQHYLLRFLEELQALRG
jgi:zinc D-Ala-D-Ala carboxypeptidase